MILFCNDCEQGALGADGSLILSQPGGNPFSNANLLDSII